MFARYLRMLVWPPSRALAFHYWRQKTENGRDRCHDENQWARDCTNVWSVPNGRFLGPVDAERHFFL